MLKDSDIPRYAVRRSKRTYSADTKAQLIAACLVPGASIAAIANEQGMNANVLHRWLQVQRQSTLSGAVHAKTPAVETSGQELPSFIPLPPVLKPSATRVIQVEVRKGALVMSVAWPMCAASEFACWSAAILK